MKPKVKEVTDIIEYTRCRVYTHDPDEHGICTKCVILKDLIDNSAKAIEIFSEDELEQHAKLSKAKDESSSEKAM